MRKIIYFILVTVMFLSIVACTKEPTKPTETVEPTTNIEVTAEPDVTQEPDVESTVEPTEKPEIQLADVDLSGAVKLNSSMDIMKPAKIGQWVEAKHYNPISETTETIYWRITDITTDCQAAIDQYNSEDHLYKVEPIVNSDLRYYLATYEVYYPVEYSAKEWGITSPTINLSAKNPNGGGFKYNDVSYIGLGSGLDFNINTDEKVMPGQVYTGEFLYSMIKEEPVYVFTYSFTAENNETVYTYVSNER